MLFNDFDIFFIICCLFLHMHAIGCAYMNTLGVITIFLLWFGFNCFRSDSASFNSRSLFLCTTRGNKRKNLIDSQRENLNKRDVSNSIPSHSLCFSYHSLFFHVSFCLAASMIHDDVE